MKLRKAADEVVAAIVDAIAGGLFGRGDLLPRQRDLAERLEVSPTVVQQAFDILRRAGIISVRRGATGGAMVISVVELPHVLASLRGETHSTLRSLAEVRRSLELTAALRAGERATEEGLARLRELVEELEDPAGFDVLLARDVRFHVAVAEVSANAVLAELVRGVIEKILLILSQFPVGRVELREAVRNQRETLAAIESRDPARIVRAVDEHMASVEELFLGERLPW